MITGFNTDVDREGRIFHVQTEDMGQGYPVVQSLVYCGGEIIDKKEIPYGEFLEQQDYSEGMLLRRMELQHQGMIREIHNGRYDQEAPKPFGHNIISNRSLDEVVLDFLQSNVTLSSIRLELLDDQCLEVGTRPTLRMKVVEEGSEAPVSGAEVVVSLISTEGEPRELFAAATDDDGFVEASFDLPELPGADLALAITAQFGEQRFVLRQFVGQALNASAQTP
jgi:hypothetical protein